MTEQQALQTYVPTGSLEAYVSSVFRLPMLSAEEEREHARNLRKNNDLSAARALVMSHLRFVVRIARGYSGYGLPQQDLIQEGTVGLMKAVRRFDPEMGVRLVSFAVHWIRAEIHEYILRNWRIVKVATTKAQRKLFFNLRSAKKRLGWLSRKEVEDVAEDLGVKPETVMEMEARLSSHDLSYDGAADADDDEVGTAPAAYIADNRMEPGRELEQEDAATDRRERLYSALDHLDSRSRDILQARWLGDDKMTLQDLADKYGVSAERIRQIEKKALSRLRSDMAA
jgi:RNA polymerase sigma-32 factor